MGLSAVLLANIALLRPPLSPASAVMDRVERNLASEAVVTSDAVSCTRTVIEDAAKALDGNTIVCTDGDVVSVWRAELDGVHLIDAVPILATDERSVELVAARVTMSARDGHAPTTSTMTIVANPASPPPPPARPAARVAPRLILSGGPTVFASTDGGSLGFQLQGEIGVGRLISLTPWVGIVPVPRHIDNAGSLPLAGTAEFRPTLFGCGVNFPLLGPSHVLVPRLGAGYAILWVHTWPNTVGPGGVANQSENIFSPAMYGTASLSLAVADPVRIVVDGMIGTALSEVDIRIGGIVAAKWGVPLASIGLRAEYVIR